MSQETPTRTLRAHPALVHVSPDIAATQRACYGRHCAFPAGPGRAVQIAFEEVTVSQADMQWRVRVHGFEFDLQFVDPAALLDLGSVLDPGVPLALQRAAVLHAASDVWHAVEQRLAARIDLVGLCGSGPSWNAGQALGLTVSLGNDAPNGPASISKPRRCAVLLRALQPEGWQRLHQMAHRLPIRPPEHDLRFDISLHAEAVLLTLGELNRVEPGDLLLLRAAADELSRPSVALKLGRRTLPGVIASFEKGRIRITQAAVPPTLTDPRGAASHTPWSSPMNPHDLASQTRPGDDQDVLSAIDAATSFALDALQVEIELELGRLSLPLSTLRALAVGQVFDTQQPIDGDGVVLWCGGQRLGVGRLMAVGERLAVRVSALGGAAPRGGGIESVADA